MIGLSRVSLAVICTSRPRGSCSQVYFRRPWVQAAGGLGYICRTHNIHVRVEGSLPVDNVCSLLSLYYLFHSLSHSLSFASLSPFFNPSLPPLASPCFLLIRLFHSLPFTPNSTPSLYLASVFGNRARCLSLLRRRWRYKTEGVESGRELTINLSACDLVDHFAYVRPLSSASVSVSKFLFLRRKSYMCPEKRIRPQHCITSSQYLSTWKFPRIFHCSVSQATLGIANSCLVGRPVQCREHICIL